MTRTLGIGMGTLKKRREDGHPPFFRDDAFWRGMGSILDSFKTFDPLYYKRDPRRADYEALQGDWERVGADFQRAIQHFETQYPAMKEVRQNGVQSDSHQGSVSEKAEEA